MSCNGFTLIAARSKAGAWSVMVQVFEEDEDDPVLETDDFTSGPSAQEALANAVLKLGDEAAVRVAIERERALEAKA